MSFEMAPIKIQQHSRANNPKECMAFVRFEPRITEGIRFALQKYVEYRLTKRYGTSFTAKRLKILLDDLLNYCCNKPVEDITRQDIIINESVIVFEIKKAIKFGATNHLYYEGSGVIDYNDINFKNQTVFDMKNTLRSTDDAVPLSHQEVYDFFGDLEV